MIRIETDQTDDWLTLRIGGRLCGSGVPALEECWRSRRLPAALRQESADLSDVTSIDRAGWRLLRRMHHDGVKICAKGLATETILDQLADAESVPNDGQMPFFRQAETGTVTGCDA